MGVIARYLERLAAIVRSTRSALPAVSADAEGLQIGREWIAWNDVRRLDAYKQDIYVGDRLCIAIVTASGRMFEITEDTAGMREVTHAIERCLPGSVPYAEWTLRLIAVSAGVSLAIYRTNSGG